MPVLRELKYAPETLARYAEFGTCVSVGMEAWWLETKRIKVGIIQGVDEGNNTITIVGSDGIAKSVNPADLVLFVEAPKGLKGK